jgi:hypothetical protein
VPSEQQKRARGVKVAGWRRRRESEDLYREVWKAPSGVFILASLGIR